MINTTKDTYTWRAIYQDGSSIDEYAKEMPDGRGFTDVDNSQVKTLELWPLMLSSVDQQTIAIHRVNIPGGATPVFFRRRRIEINAATDEDIRSTTHCIGWKKGESTCYLFISDDGSVLLTSELQAV